MLHLTFLFFLYYFKINTVIIIFPFTDIVIPGANSTTDVQARISAGEVIHIIRGSKGTFWRFWKPKCVRYSHVPLLRYLHQDKRWKNFCHPLGEDQPTCHHRVHCSRRYGFTASRLNPSCMQKKQRIIKELGVVNIVSIIFQNCIFSGKFTLVSKKNLEPTVLIFCTWFSVFAVFLKISL